MKNTKSWVFGCISTVANELQDNEEFTYNLYTSWWKIEAIRQGCCGFAGSTVEKSNNSFHPDYDLDKAYEWKVIFRRNLIIKGT